MKLLAWKLEEGTLIFQLKDATGRLILGNGIFEYEI